MFRNLGLLGSFSLLVLMNGCVSSSYPGHWPAPSAATDSQCQDLSGSYDNFGVWDDGARVVLAQLFFPLKLNDSQMLNYELLAVSHLKFTRRTNDTYLIEAYVGDELLLARAVDAQQWVCNEGRVVVHVTDWSLAGVPPFLPVVTRDSIERNLLLAADGSLVIENQVGSIGLALIIPLAMKSRYWYLFAPVGPALAEDPHRPRGVRVGSDSTVRLLPPEGAPDWSGYKSAGNCIDAAGNPDWLPRSETLDALGAQSAQAFVLQDGKYGAVIQSGTVVDSDWLPADHNLRIQKQHWQPPEFADRYVMCLLESGYRWAEPDE